MENRGKWEQMAAELHGELQKPSVQHNQEEDIRIEKALKRIHASGKDVKKIREFQPSEIVWDKLKGKFRQNIRITEWLRYAAVAAIAVSITILVNYLVGNNTSENQYASVSSPVGQITNLTLFDGTNVWLNAGSTLKYKKSFNQSDREVYLDGEALFDVAKDKSRLFIVNAGKAKIKVHGTIFDVKAYLNMPTVETVLIEGSVEFISNGNSVFMNPGEHLVCSSKTGKFTKSEINTTEYTAWKGGKIYFSDKTLYDLALQLERWYEVKFRFDSEELKNYRFTGVINKDNSLDYTLDIIEEINKVEFKTNQEEIIIMTTK